MSNQRESGGEEEVDDTLAQAVGDGEDELANEETVNDARKSRTALPPLIDAL